MSFHSFSPFCALLLIKTKAGREKRSEKEAILRILGHFLFFYLSSSFLFARYFLPFSFGVGSFSLLFSLPRAAFNQNKGWQGEKEQKRSNCEDLGIFFFSPRNNHKRVWSLFSSARRLEHYPSPFFFSGTASLSDSAKLTWLVLGEDQAARSHRVEQLTAL